MPVTAFWWSAAPAWAHPSPTRPTNRNGATMVESVDDVWADSDLLLKVKEPIEDEYKRLGARKNQVLFTYLHLAASRECTDALVAANNVAIAYETVRLRDNSLPLLTPMSEVAGRMAPLMGAHHLMRPGGGHGDIDRGVPVWPPPTSWSSARGSLDWRRRPWRSGCTPTSRSLIATSNACAKWTSTSTVAWRRSPRRLSLSKSRASGPTWSSALCLVVGAKAPKLVSNELVSRMREGSVLVDISVDQGGCFEATRPTTHSNPTFVVQWFDLLLRGEHARCGSRDLDEALSNATLPYVLELARHGWREAVLADDALAEGVNVVNGKVTYGPVAEALDMDYTPLRSLL